jgi:hypothetical protein
MRIILAVITFIVCAVPLSGQTAEEESIRLRQEGELYLEEKEAGHQETDPADRPGDALPGLDKGNLGLSVGTSYSYSRGYGSGMLFFAAPSYTLPLNNRWSLHTGFIASYYQYLNPGMYGETLMTPQYSSLAVFAAASYRMNDKLVLHGTGVKRLVSAPIAPFTPYPMDNISLGATYKIGDNITIGATIHLNNGQGVYANPYNGYHFNSPFFW